MSHTTGVKGQHLHGVGDGDRRAGEVALAAEAHQKEDLARLAALEKSFARTPAAAVARGSRWAQR